MQNEAKMKQGKKNLIVKKKKSFNRGNEILFLSKTHLCKKGLKKKEKKKKRNFT
jgi:hypothetical protein